MSQRKIDTTKRSIISTALRTTKRRQGLFYALEKEAQERSVGFDYLKHKPYKCDIERGGKNEVI